MLDLQVPPPLLPHASCALLLICNACFLVCYAVMQHACMASGPMQLQICSSKLHQCDMTFSDHEALPMLPCSIHMVTGPLPRHNAAVYHQVQMGAVAPPDLRTRPPPFPTKALRPA